MTEVDAFMLLPSSDVSSLFQPLIMLVHFVLTVFVESPEGKDLFFS